MSETNQQSNDRESEQDRNPYQAPATPPAEVSVDFSNPQVVRSAYLAHEASVRSIGYLFLFAGSVCITPIMGLLVGLFSVGLLPEDVTLSIGIVAFSGFALLGVGWGLYRLRNWARLIAAALSVLLSLFQFPFGTAGGIFMLYFLFSEKGNIVFSDEYSSVIAQTPHMRPRTSGLMWLLGLLLLCLLGFAAFAVFTDN